MKQLKIISKGSGSKKLVFIHGNSQSGKIWNPVVNYIDDKEFTSIQIDLLGSGESKSDEFCFNDIVETLLSTLKQYDNSPYILVGSSFGTNLIARVAINLQNCKGIILSSASCVSSSIPLDHIFLPNPKTQVLYMENADRAEVTQLFASDLQIESEESLNFLVDSYFATSPHQRQNIALEMTKFMNGTKPINEFELIAKTGIPTANIQGGNDTILVGCGAENCGLNFWNGHTQLIDECGHFIPLDQPKIFANLVTSFAKEQFT